MQQYFIKGLKPTGIIKLEDKETIRHIFSVMRLTQGDHLILVFDDGIKHLAKVLDRDLHTFELIKPLPDWSELPVEVTIAVGFPKGDKLDLISQKATELGAHAIWAYPAQWSVVKWDSKKRAKKAEKLLKIAQGAAEQSKRNRIPAVRLFEHKEAFIACLSDFDRVFVAYEEEAKRGEKARLARELASLAAGERVLFIFGPEGGLSSAEVQSYQSLGARTLGLGPRILRAETAPLYALSAVSFALELEGQEGR